MPAGVRTLLYLGAEWSTPSMLMKPMVMRLAREFRLESAVLDVDRRPDLIRRYALRGLPVLILADGDTVLKRWDGFRSELEIRRDLGRHL